MKTLTLKQNLIWNSTGCLIYQGCQWLTTIFVVTLSPTYENSGTLAFAMAIGNLYTAFATYNIRTFQVSDTKNEYSNQNYVGFRLITVFLAFVVFGIYAYIVSPSRSTFFAILIFLIFKADESFVNILYGIEQKASRMDYIGISQGIRGILSIGSFSSLLSFSGNLPLAIAAMFLSCFIVTLFFDIPKSRKLSRLRPSITRSLVISLFKKCAPLFASLAFYGTTASIVRQYFGITYGEDALGIYAAIATPCVLVQVLANYMYSPFLTPLAESWNSGNIIKMLGELKKACLLMTLTIVLCVATSLLAGPMALEAIYGSSIDEYSWMITPAIVAASLMASNCFVADYLIVIRCFKESLSINVIALLLCTVSMAPLTEYFYMNGINIALITSFGPSTVIGMLMILKRCNRFHVLTTRSSRNNRKNHPR